MKGARTQSNQRNLAFIVLISGVVGGLLIVFSILLLCKYFLNRKNLREAEQMKLLCETLSRAPFMGSNRSYPQDAREFSPLEPRRSNPMDRYQLPEDLWQIPSAKDISPDYQSTASQPSHPPLHHETRGQNDNQARDSVMEDESAEQDYLQVDPRCYVRQNSNVSLDVHRKSDTPRLEKGHSLNVDTRPSPSTNCVSPHRQSSFDVAVAHHFQQQQQQPGSTLSPGSSTQHDLYYTPHGSSLSVMVNQSFTTPLGSQHLSAPVPSTQRKYSTGMILERKNLSATLDSSGPTSTIRSSISQREHEHSRSLEHSSPPVTEQLSLTNNASNDKQSLSFDAVHLLRPGSTRPETTANRRTKSYENAEERRPSIAPPPIVIKIPDMSELVQAAQLSRLQHRRETVNMEDYQRNAGRKLTLVQQSSMTDQNQEHTAPRDLWRLRQSYELEEQQRQFDRMSPEDLSLDLSTSIDSAGAMPVDSKANGTDDDPSKYQHRRKSSCNLLLPPPEVRRQALRRTFEKRRTCINQSNARREQELLDNQPEFDQENNPLTDSKIDFSNLLKNLNAKSENSSFERSLETDFDVQSDTSSRGPNDQFTSIESSGNENTLPDINHRMIISRRQPQQQQQQQQSPQISPHQDDSGYKSLESQNSQNRTISLDWMSADGGESVIYLGESQQTQISVDRQDPADNSMQQEYRLSSVDPQRRSPKLLPRGFHHPSQDEAVGLTSPHFSNSDMKQQRSLSTNIPLVADHFSPTPINHKLLIHMNQSRSMTSNNSNNNNNKSISIHNHKLVTSSSFIRTASKKRREFGKDKRHAASNATNTHLTTEDYSARVHQVNELDTRLVSSPSLQVRHSDLRRTKSDGSRTLASQATDEESSNNESTTCSNDTRCSTRLSSSTDGVPVWGLSPASNRQYRSPGAMPNEVPQPILQHSSSSSSTGKTPDDPSSYSHLGLSLLDSQTSPSNSATGRAKSPTPVQNMASTHMGKPRFKFSLVRDSAMASVGHHAPVYSMPITRDYSIDERTNRIVNEFLMHDPTLDDKKRSMVDDTSHRSPSKRQHHHHHHRIRARTLEESTMMTYNNNTPKQLPQQPVRSTVNKQRYPIPLQAVNRKHAQSAHSSVHLTDSIERNQEEEDDSSDRQLPLVILNQQSNHLARRDNSLAAGSPSIIITGDDSGS